MSQGIPTKTVGVLWVFVCHFYALKSERNSALLLLQNFSPTRIEHEPKKISRNFSKPRLTR
jgi:hypothetical protein